jgi:putative resolvase
MSRRSKVSKSFTIEHVMLCEASEMLGVCEKTLRVWGETGKIQVVRTPGGHRRIPLSEVRRLQGKVEAERTMTLAYCRCSTKKQEENLERQVGRVLEYCAKRGWQVELFKDIGSGLNERRRNFKKLMDRAANPDVARIVVEYTDRLTRFGWDTFRSYCQRQNVDVIVIESRANKEFEQELVEDMIALITSYSARLYGRRGGRKPKAKVVK